jgi:hypothetical protein
MLLSLPALKRAEARAPERGVYAASATIVFGSVEFFMCVYAGGTTRHEEKQTGEGERWHGAGKFECCICRPRFFVFRFGAVRQPISVVLPKHGRMFLPLRGERVGVRGNEANSDFRRTTIPGIVKLRESLGWAYVSKFDMRPFALTETSEMPLLTLQPLTE